MSSHTATNRDKRYLRILPLAPSTFLAAELEALQKVVPGALDDMLDEGQSFVTGDGQTKDILANLLLRASPTQAYSASLAQQRLWFLNQLDGRSTAYNVHLGLWLRGSLDFSALQSALQEMVNRHDSLRTAFRLEGVKLLQVVTEACPVCIPVTDLSSAGDPTAEAYQLAQREIAEPFDLSIAPLFRARLFRATPEDHVFLCTMHHIVTDASSLQLFAEELALLYGEFSNGRKSPLPQLPIQYGDFSEWQLEWFHADAVQHQIAYWKNTLAGAPPLLELPMDTPRPAEQTLEGTTETAPVSRPTVDRIKTLAASCQATPFMVELSAFKLLLYRYSGQPDVLVGVPVSGRNRVETEGLIGFFVNTLVLRDDLSGNPTFTELVAQVRETMLGAFSNAEVPFEKIVEVLQPERSLSHNPIFQVMFASIKSAVRSHEFGNLTAFPYVVTTGTSIFDLTMTLIEDIDQQWWAQIEYSTRLFTRERIRRIVSDYTALLDVVVDNPQARILNLPVLSMPGPVDVPSSRSYSRSGGEPRRRNQRTPASLVPAGTASGRSSDPGDPEQRFLVDLWKQVLGVPDLGIYDSFFQVGGHSLLAARLVTQIHQITGKQIPVSAIFRAPTIVEFAPLLRDYAGSQPDAILMPLQQGDGSIPFFAVATPGADTFGFSLLARHMGHDQPVYKLQAPEPILWGRPFTKDELRALVRQYVAAMRSVQPHGPYCLGGMCEGVLIAQEIILDLESQGEEVGMFAILDTWVLENSQIPVLWAMNYYQQRLQVFRDLSWAEQRATIKKTVKRLFFQNGHSAEVGWNQKYWPGEDFQNPQFEAPVLLFKRPRQPYYRIRDPQMGWGARSRGGVEIHDILCGHTEMLRQPHVGIVGQILTNLLQRIRDREAQSNSGFAVASNRSPDLRKLA